MKSLSSSSQLLLAVLLLSAATLFQGAVSFVPSQTFAGARTTSSSSELCFFGGNKKATATADAPKGKAAQLAKKQQKAKAAAAQSFNAKSKNTNTNGNGAAWKKFARIAVTGSPDGISLLGKPQHDWVTGKALSKPKSHSWISSYKQTESRKKK
mmetsp:Transcript_25603/g.38294  ORF Transcript_25603/g.38294 Transcript_25603/m.38294 type:complete len:154 (+) Transcript_25603:97-558(+)